MSSKLKLFVNDPQLWDSFLTELDTRLDLAQRNLQQATDIPDVYRAQGEVKAIQSLQKLRDKVNGG